MRPEIAALKEGNFDLIIIGGGAFGACAAWDATLRGLRVALVDAEDFGAGVSANCYKMIHGGMRYMQHADVVRVRGSCRERSAFMRIAPHLVQPLPILMPTYGWGMEGKPILAAGMYAFDLLTLDRNRGVRERTRRIPMTRFLSRAETLEHCPAIGTEGLTGAALFCDGQMYNPTRLILAFVQSAAARGAVAVNHCQATELQISGGRVRGCLLEDKVSGETFSVESDCVINAAGPWARELLNEQTGLSLTPKYYSRDACFVVKRKFEHDVALAIQGESGDADALLSRKARHLFIVPWREYSLIGVWHTVFSDGPDNVRLGREDLNSYIREINGAYPTLDLSLDDVLMCNSGLVPFGDDADGDDLSFGKRSTLIDHESETDLAGLVSLVGIRYTMARVDAAAAVDLACRQLNKRCGAAPTESTPIWGGDIEDLSDLTETAKRRFGPHLGEKQVTALVRNYGTNYTKIAELAENLDDGLYAYEGCSSIRAEISNAVQNEWALTLSDIVFRRTDIATAGNPGMSTLEQCADAAAEELGWGPEQKSAQLEDVISCFPNFAD